MKNIILIVVIAVIALGVVWFFVIREPVDLAPVAPNDFVDPKPVVLDDPIDPEPVDSDPVVLDDPVDPKPVDPEIVDPVVEEEIPIELELCRKAITLTQLRNITGKDDFVFKEIEEEDPFFGIAKICNIRLAEIEVRPEEPEITIVFLSLEAYETIKGFLPLGGIVPIDIDDIGKRAFFMRVDDPSPVISIVFIDGDINQTIIVTMDKEIFDREILENLAKQIEKNLK